MRGSLTGSVVSNILLVLGAAMIAGGDGTVDARSLRWQLFAVFGAVALFTIQSAFSSGSMAIVERHCALPRLDPVAIMLLAVYIMITVRTYDAAAPAERTALQQDLDLESVRSGDALRSRVRRNSPGLKVLVRSLEHFGKQ